MLESLKITIFILTKQLIFIMGKRTNTGNKIKDVSLDLFSIHGFAGTSVRQISGTIGIRESGIYNHFSSKEDILRILMEDVKNSTVGVEIITDELLDKLSNPSVFMKEFVQVLIKRWNTQKQKKYLRLVLIEQFREIKGVNVSLNLMVDESINIWSMIFSQMLKFRFIKKNDPLVLAEEFVYPIFMLRLQYLVEEKVDLKKVLEKCNSHIDYFWKSIKR